MKLNNKDKVKFEYHFYRLKNDNNLNAFKKVNYVYESTGEQIIFFANDTIRNIKIMKPGNSNDQNLASDKQIYYMNILPVNDAICIETTLSESNPYLKIYFELNGEQFEEYIKNTEDKIKIILNNNDNFVEHKFSPSKKNIALIPSFKTEDIKREVSIYDLNTSLLKKCYIKSLDQLNIQDIDWFDDENLIIIANNEEKLESSNLGNAYIYNIRTGEERQFISGSIESIQVLGDKLFLNAHDNHTSSELYSLAINKNEISTSFKYILGDRSLSILLF